MIAAKPAFALFLGLLAGSLECLADPPSVKPMPTVALDIGHTLAKPGATSARGVPEFEFNRALATRVEATLGEREFRTRVVNADGKIADLAERPAQAGDADFFLSIHHDSAQPRYLSRWRHQGKTRAYSDRFAGFALFVSRKNPYLAQSLACASVIGLALRQAGFQPSRYHAEPIEGENRPFADEANGVHYYDDLIVLKLAKTPAALLEAGVILNRDEEKTLAEPETQAAIARAVREGLRACLTDAAPGP